MSTSDMLGTFAGDKWLYWDHQHCQTTTVIHLNLLNLQMTSPHKYQTGHQFQHPLGYSAAWTDQVPSVLRILCIVLDDKKPETSLTTSIRGVLGRGDKWINSYPLADCTTSASSTTGYSRWESSASFTMHFTRSTCPRGRHWLQIQRLVMLGRLISSHTESISLIASARNTVILKLRFKF